MKKAKNTLVCVLVMLLSVLSFAACAGMDDGYKSYAPSGDTSDYQSNDSSLDEWQAPLRKQLTAAEWSDATYYEFWRSLFAQGGEQGTRGIFSDYARYDRGLTTADMHEIRVETDGKAVAGARVRLYNRSALVYSAVTDANGKAYVFGNATNVEAESGLYTAGVPLTPDGVTTVHLNGAQEKQNVIEMALVVDTTASMGDELGYLKKELDGVLRRICRTTGVQMRLGMVFYRDDGDEYVTRTFDFADVSYEAGLMSVRENLNAQTAWGGGDYPERADRALAEAMRLQWSDRTSTKLLFHVLDAPYHDTREQQKIFADAVYAAAGNGVRIIPLAASGLDTFGQYIMRSAALLTGGTYTFLTDDSGIGNGHDEPETGGYTVEYLSDLLVRLTVGYHTGNMSAPVHWTQSPDVL